MSRKLMRRVLAIEGLETRRVLHSNFGGIVSLGLDGLLTVEGGRHNDRISVCVTGEMGDMLTVKVNRTSHEFNLADVTGLHITGDKGNDRIAMSGDLVFSAFMDGGRGNDWLWSGGGADHLVGGAGNDRLFGGDGDDLLEDAEGNNKFWGGAGNDTMHGGRGHDRMFGGDGDDQMWGGEGHDRLFGEAGLDVLHGEGGKDKLYGGDDDDQLFGGDDKDHANGGDGNDWIDGGEGKDKLWGGLGDDSIKGGLGNDHLNGNEGVNLLDGDEGFNRLWNGTEHDFEAEPEQPEDPPSDPGDPTTVEYVTSLSDSSYSATVVFTDDGTEQVLTLNVTGPVGDFVVFMIEGNVWAMFELTDGTYSARFSSLHDDAGEEAFPDGCILVDGAEVSCGSLVGPLNMSVASAS